MQQQPNNTRLVIKLLSVVVGMFAFGFALVPLYDVFCDITGLNGKTAGTAAVAASEVDTSRTVTVEFVTRTQGNMAWEFRAETKRVRVHPGEMTQVDFTVKNPTTRSIVGHAVPSVSPGQAALYLNKTECFCFNNQPLAPGEEATMPMVFYVDPGLPADIGFFTLQYTFYDVTQANSELAMGNTGD